MIHSQFNLNISAKDVYNDKGVSRLKFYWEFHAVVPQANFGDQSIVACLNRSPPWRKI